MSMSNTAETAFLNLIFANTDFANIGDATGLRGSSTAGSLYLSLHTADPGEAGSQTTSEATYTSYARVAVNRTTGFSVSGNSATLAALTSFPACTGGSNTITYFGIGTDSSGAGTLLFSGALNASLSVSSGVTPQLTTATSVTFD